MTIRNLEQHVEPALMLSIGEAPDEGRNYPRKLDWFRAKPGKDAQWKRAADQFNQVYGVQIDPAGRPTNGPKAVPIYLHSNEVSECVDVRYLAFGTDRLAARGVTNYAEHPELAGERERILAYPPDQPEPIERWISGPADPYCLGGQDGIPTDKQGKPTLAIRTTLYFGLADVGTFTAPCAISTSSTKSTGQILQALWRIRTTGTLTGWLLLLVVKPTRVTYWDQKEGKRKRSSAFTWDVIGPVGERLNDEGKRIGFDPLTVPQMRAEIDQAHQRRLLSGLPEQGIQKTGELPPARPEAEIGPGEQPDAEWSDPPAAADEVESTAVEVDGDPVCSKCGQVDHPDHECIPFG